jgi:hypothetical protein
MLLVLGLGKLATVLGGTGQGLPTTAEPATAYLGPGPWGSLGPAIPAIPAQAIEGLATIGVLVVVATLSLVPVLRRPDGRLFLLALGMWAMVRAVVASTWRDPVAFGPLRAEQVIGLVVAVGSALLGATLLVANRGDDSEHEPVGYAAAEPRSVREVSGPV